MDKVRWLGIILGLILATYLNVGTKWWIFIFCVGLILGIYRNYKNGKPEFWKWAGSHPEEAYSFYKEDSEVWLVIDNPASDKEIDKNTWVGPFRLFVPSLGRTIKIYGKNGKYEERQSELLSKLINK